VPGSELRLKQVGLNPRRTGLLQALRMMGADIVEDNGGVHGGEPVADLVVRYAPLRGIEVPERIGAGHDRRIPGAVHRRRACQRSDRGARRRRIAGQGIGSPGRDGQRLRALGLQVDETPDGATIHPGTLQGGVVDSLGDHRIAMAFAVGAQRALGEVRIGDVANVATSFPGFDALARGVGCSLSDA
jgi:3-phosphoshikimate 1-carboxyvinyltransferase